MNETTRRTDCPGSSFARATAPHLSRGAAVVVGLSGLFHVTEAVPQQREDAVAYGEQELEEILVTGSRIVRRDYESASPIVTTSDSLFDLSGSPSVQTMLNTLPQFAPWLTETTNNRTGPVPPGQAILDLRGMGLGRTLVLLDGRRMVAANPWGAVDVNLIPEAIVERVEIITGGASAVYGSEAVAGVVNFRTRRFSGLELEASREQTDQGDGTGWHAGLTGGAAFARGYAYGHFSYTERDPVMQADRGFSAVALGYDQETGEFVPDGSTGIRQGRWTQQGFNLPTQRAIDAYLGRVDAQYVPGAVSNRGAFGFNQDGSPFSMSPVYNFTGATSDPLQPVNRDWYTYNFAPDNYLRVPAQRANFFGKVGIDLTDESELFVQLLWADQSASLQLAPTPMGGVYVGADNPFIQRDLAALLASRPDPGGLMSFAKRLTELGPRRKDTDYAVVQIVVGAEGGLSLMQDWQYVAYATWGGVDQVTVRSGDASRSAFEELSMAADAGASICGGEGMNPFGIDSISSECAAHFERGARDRTTVRQLIAEASASGPFLQLPAGSARSAVGILYREDSFDYAADKSNSGTRIDPLYGFETQDFTGGISQSIEGQTHSWEVYLEANLPLLADLPLAESLEVAVGYRYADHSNAGSIDAWKGETIWRPAAPVTIRSSFQRAVRAPDFNSLFQPQTTGFWGLGRSGEPCEYDFESPYDELVGAQQDPEVAALCIAQGIPTELLPTFFDADEVVDFVAGGNPDLKEETADTLTLGVVLRSPWSGVLEGLQGSVDYFRIEIDDVIGYVENLVFPCYDRSINPNLDPENFYCQRFQRDPVTHEVTNALNTAVNSSRMATSGYDFQLDYAIDAGPGSLRLNGVATYTESASFKAAPRVPTLEYASKATGYAVTAESAVFNLMPRWKVVADVSYATGGLLTNLRWRYVGSLQDEWIESFRLPSRQYWDLTVGYAFESGLLDGLTLRGGVTNLGDQQPVIYPSYVEANTEPSTYDVLGRRYFLRATYTF